MSTLTTSLASSDVGMCMCVGCNVIQHVIINDTAIIGSKSLTLLIMLCLKQLYIINYITIDYVTNTCTHF